MSTHPSWSRTPGALSLRRLGTCTSPKLSPQTLATTPVWWRIQSPRPESRVRPRHWCSVVMVSHTNLHNLKQSLGFYSFFKLKKKKSKSNPGGGSINFQQSINWNLKVNYFLFFINLSMSFTMWMWCFSLALSRHYSGKGHCQKII